MFKLAIAILAFIAVAIEGRPHSEAVDFDCVGKTDGFYPDPTDPKAFFTCQDETVMKRVVCLGGYKFDGVETCIPDVEEEVNEERERPTIPQVYGDSNEDSFVDDDDNSHASQGKKRVFNIEITKNVFPRSVVIIGRANREQKNK